MSRKAFIDAIAAKFLAADFIPLDARDQWPNAWSFYWPSTERTNMQAKTRMTKAEVEAVNKALEGAAGSERGYQAALARADAAFAETKELREAWQDAKAAKELAESLLQRGRAASRASIDQLKGELAAAREAIARQEGYIGRALEDDAMRELGPIPGQPPAAVVTATRRNGVLGGSELSRDYDFRRQGQPVPKPWFAL